MNGVDVPFNPDNQSRGNFNVVLYRIFIGAAVTALMGICAFLLGKFDTIYAGFIEMRVQMTLEMKQLHMSDDQLQRQINDLRADLIETRKRQETR